MGRQARGGRGCEGGVALTIFIGEERDHVHVERCIDTDGQIIQDDRMVATGTDSGPLIWMKSGVFFLPPKP